MSTPSIAVREGHPDFLDLDWAQPIDKWEGDRLIELPAGIHRHPVRFVAYDDALYAVKELNRPTAIHEFETLRTLEGRVARVASPVALVDRPWLSSDVEGAGAIITQYVEYAFPYRDLVSEGGFGRQRSKLLDAFAGLLVELHLAGCFWGDCSLSNVLYRYDAGAIEAVMIDAETSELHDTLSDGQRLHDLEIMELNVAGGMADIAAERGLELDQADLRLGVDIAERYHALWRELTEEVVIGPHERFRIRERVRRLNDLGFDLDELELIPTGDGSDQVKMRVHVAGRHFHANKLRELTRIEASENQARQILADLAYHEARYGGTSATGKALSAIRWRVDVFEPLLARIAADAGPGADPVQGYCDFLHHRYLRAAEAGKDISNEDAYESWLEAGMPGREP